MGTQRFLRVHCLYWTPERRRSHAAAGRPPLADAHCDPRATIQLLGAASQPALRWIDRAFAWTSIFLRRRRIASRTETGCWAVGKGIPVRDAQHSTDGFWTVDVRLASFAIGDWTAPEGRYVRVELEPGTEAHRIASRRFIRPTHRLEFAGPILVDEEGPFLEVHPDAEFRLLSETHDAPLGDPRVRRMPRMRAPISRRPTRSRSIVPPR